MKLTMTKKELLQLLQEAIFAWKKSPPPIQELLNAEIGYVVTFRILIAQFPLTDNEDVIRYATQKFKHARNQSFKNICKVLDQQQVPADKIYDCIGNNKFIAGEDWKKYSQQMVGEFPIGFKREVWESYNHWLLTNIYWDAFVWSQGREFEKLLQHDVAWKENAFFGSNKIKPLWAMWLQALEAEIPS
jgi:hypothetical protein